MDGKLTSARDISRCIPVMGRLQVIVPSGAAALRAPVTAREKTRGGMTVVNFMVSEI